MAVALEGFSIREYTSWTRSVDVLKCWPFDDVSKETAEALLPPIRIRKFSWWCDEVELVRSKCINDEEKQLREPSERLMGCSGLKREEEFEALKIGALGDGSKAIGALADDKLRLSCSVCRVFTASTEKAVNARVDTCLARSSREEKRKTKIKGKLKAPKKRSIVEIFAVSPQVESVDVDEEEDEDDYGIQEHRYLNSKILGLAVAGLKGERNKKEKHTKSPNGSLTITSKYKKTVNTLKKGKKKERECLDLPILSILKKEKSHKLELQSSALTNGNQHRASIVNELERDGLGASPIHQKKSRLNCLSIAKKIKTVRTPKLILKHQKPVLPIRGILRSNKKVATGQKPMSNLQDLKQMSFCLSQQSNRYVRFSGKDDILESRKKSFPFVECHSLENNEFSNFSVGASLLTDHATEKGKCLAIVKVNGSDEGIPSNREDESETQRKIKKPFSVTRNVVDMPEFLRLQNSCQESLPDKFVTPDQVALCSGSFDMTGQAASFNPLYDCSPRFLSFPDVVSDPNMNSQGGRCMSAPSRAADELINQSGLGLGPRVTGACLSDDMKMHFRSSSSFVEMDETSSGKLPFLSQNNQKNNNDSALQYHSFCHLSPKEHMHGIFSYPDWKPRAVMCEHKSTDEDFIGLPLNSQGELIQIESVGNCDFSQRIQPSMVTCSSVSLDMHGKALHKSTSSYSNFENFDDRSPPEQLKLFPLEDFVKKNSNLLVPPRFHVSKLQDAGGTDIHFLDAMNRSSSSLYPKRPDQNLTSLYHPEHNYHDMFRRSRVTGMTHQDGNPGHTSSANDSQPTMRLMGKEFTVGTSKGLEDGKVWMDKQIITEHTPGNISMDKSSEKKLLQEDMMLRPVSREVDNILAYPSEFYINRAPQSLQANPPPEYMFSHPDFHFGSSIVYQYGSSSSNRNPASESHPYSPRFGSPGIHYRPTHVQEHCIYRQRTVNDNRQMQTLRFTPQNVEQKVSPKISQSRSKQKLPHATKYSAFKFPFLHSDCGEFFQPPLFPRPTGLPPWLLNATRQKEDVNITSLSPYSDVFGSHPPSTISGANFPPMYYCTSEFSSPYNHISQPALQNFPSPASVPYHPHMPIHGDFVPTSVKYNKQGDKKMTKNRIQLRICSKDPAHHRSKARKRPAAKTQDIMKATKIPHLEAQEDFRCSLRNAGDDFGGNTRWGARPSELDPTWAKANTVGYFQDIAQRERCKVFLGSDSLKQDAVARSGPIKLTAGAKHILKPSQKIDQINSRPVYCTSPFSPAMDSGRTDPESEKKSTRIYRL